MEKADQVPDIKYIYCDVMADGISVLYFLKY
jgi:hypothetical protein